MKSFSQIKVNNVGIKGVLKNKKMQYISDFYKLSDLRVFRQDKIISSNFKRVRKENHYKHKVLQFNSVSENLMTDSAILTENEINNLFLGFVRLIKKNVIIQKEDEYKKDIVYFSNRLAECMIEIDKKNQEIKTLRKTIKDLSVK